MWHQYVLQRLGTKRHLWHLRSVHQSHLQKPQRGDVGELFPLGACVPVVSLNPEMGSTVLSPMSLRLSRRPVSLTGERPCSWSWTRRSSAKRWPSRWRSGTGTWWERMTSWERSGRFDVKNNLFKRWSLQDDRFFCSRVLHSFPSLHPFVLFFFWNLQVEIPFACLHKTPRLEGWFRLLPLGNNEVDAR